jgi:putative membrane protein
MPALFAFLHFLAAFVLFATLAVELVLCRAPLDLPRAKRLVVVDLVYGLAATLVLVAGFARVLWFEKGPSFYFHDAPFILKLALFITVGLLSIYPTMQFLRMRPALRRGEVPVLDAPTMKRMRLVIHVEATLVVLIILCASLMARGIGYFGHALGT